MLGIFITMMISNSSERHNVGRIGQTAIYRMAD